MCKKHMGITLWTLLQDGSCILGLPRELPAVTIPSPYNSINLLFTTEARGCLWRFKSDVTWLKTLLTVLRIKPKSLVHLRGLHIGRSPRPHLTTGVALSHMAVCHLSQRPTGPRTFDSARPLSWHLHPHPGFRGVVAPPEASPTSGQANCPPGSPSPLPLPAPTVRSGI